MSEETTVQKAAPKETPEQRKRRMDWFFHFLYIIIWPYFRLIHPVQNHQPGFARSQLVYIRVPAGDRDPGVQNLAHGVHIAELLGNHPPGFGHVAGVPLNVHTITPIRWKFRRLVSSSGPGKATAIALPIT